MGAFLMPWGRQQLANVEKWSGTTTTRPADSDTSSVRTEKTKSPGGWAGLSAHVKMKNRLHIAKGATCSS